MRTLFYIVNFKHESKVNNFKCVTQTRIKLKIKKSEVNSSYLLSGVVFKLVCRGVEERRIGVSLVILAPSSSALE